MYLNEPSFSSMNLQKSDYNFTTGTAHSLLSKWMRGRILDLTY